MLGGKHHVLPLNSGSRATLLPAVLSVPLALLLGLGIILFPVAIPGDPSAFIVTIIGLGLLTSLDLRRGFKTLIEGFAVSLMVSFFVIDRSVIGSALLPMTFGEWSFVLIALPVGLAVLLSGFILSHVKKYRVIWASLVGSAALVIGLGVGTALSTRSSAPGSSALTPEYYLALSVPANAIQIGIFYLLERLGRAKQFSLKMMPTAFCGLNLLSFLGFVNTQNFSQLYMFFSSFAFLPVLGIAGVGSNSLVSKSLKVLRTSPAPTPGAPPKSAGHGSPTKIPPSIRVTANSIVLQGRELVLKIATDVRGQVRNMARIVAEVTRPGGKRESVRVQRVGSGEYKAVYKPPASGSYTVHVSAMDQTRQTADKSFSFTAQSPPAKPSPPPSPPPSHSRPTLTPSPPPQSRPAPIFAPTPSPQPAPARLSLPNLGNWDPKVWVGQEIHGYMVREYIATGLSGYVLRASFEHGGNEMAIKIPILRPGTGTTALDDTMSEATRLLELSQQSKYVVQLRGILVDRLNVQEILKGDTALYLKSPPAIVMELMKGGAAKALVEDPGYDSLYYSEKWPEIVVLIGTMIATGLETIHNAGFAHLDVKPQNILFNVKPSTTGREARDQIRNGALVPKLADLGSAVRIGGKVTQFTPEYAPGEQALGEKASSAMDVYALGATMYSLLTKTPANSKKLIVAMNNMTDNPGSGRASELTSTWNGFTPDFTPIAKFSSLVGVLRKILARQPADRPGAGSVVTSLRGLGDLSSS